MVTVQGRSGSLLLDLDPGVRKITGPGNSWSLSTDSGTDFDRSCRSRCKNCAVFFVFTVSILALWRARAYNARRRGRMPSGPNTLSSVRIFLLLLLLALLCIYRRTSLKSALEKQFLARFSLSARTRLGLAVGMVNVAPRALYVIQPFFFSSFFFAVFVLILLFVLNPGRF